MIRKGGGRPTPVGTTSGSGLLSRQTVFDFSRSFCPFDSIADDHEIIQLVHDVRHSCRRGCLDRERSNSEYDDRESGAHNFDHARQHQHPARYNIDSHCRDLSRKESGHRRVARGHSTATTHPSRREQTKNDGIPLNLVQHSWDCRHFGPDGHVGEARLLLPFGQILDDPEEPDFRHQSRDNEKNCSSPPLK